MSDFLSNTQGVAGPMFTGIGSILQYQGARGIGKQAVASAGYEAAQLRQNAGQAQAASQRVALDRLRDGRYAQSRALAVAAASGAGASDPTVLNIIASLDGESAYRAALARFSGDERARAMRDAADARVATGAAAQRASKIQAGRALLGGASLFSKYGSGGFQVRDQDSGGLSDTDWWD